VFRDLAKKHETPYLPFLLDGVAMKPELMQRDALHPNAAGTRKVAESVFRVLEPMLKK
jgi:acyl-CoA thioesterase-1